LELSIIIVSYNVKCFVEQCLYSVLNAVKNIDAEIIVIDNNSTDGSYDYLNFNFTNVKFIWNKKNIGFSKANNIALAQATGKLVLFLNPDTIVAEDCLDKCLSFFKAQKNIGALGIRMIDGTGKYLKESKRGFPTPFTSLYKITGLTALFPNSKRFAKYYLGHLPPNKNHVVDVLSGAFMIVDKNILDITNGFDESFFMYGEDIDLSFRIQKAGYKNYYFSGSSIIHFKGESTKKNNIRYVILFYGAMNLFVKKHYSVFESLIYRFLINVAVLLKVIADAINKSFSFLKNTFSKKSIKTLQAVLISTEKEYVSLTNILKSVNAKLKIKGVVEPSSLQITQSLGNIKQLGVIVKQHQIDVVIFCINTVSLKEVINIMQSHRMQVNYSFHFVNSDSVVGSNNKNSAGDFIALNKLSEL